MPSPLDRIYGFARPSAFQVSAGYQALQTTYHHEVVGDRNFFAGFNSFDEDRQVHPVLVGGGVRAVPLGVHLVLNNAADTQPF